MWKRSLLLLLALALALSLGSQALGADFYGKKTSNFGVTQRLRIYYNGGTCNGEERIKITVVAVKYTRSRTDRGVPRAHVAGVQDGRRCSDGTYIAGTAKTVTVHPKFGCGGRCDPNKTEEMGFAPSWPYVMLLSGCDIPFCFIGGSGHAHVKNKNTGKIMGTICTKKEIAGAAPGCQ